MRVEWTLFTLLVSEGSVDGKTNFMKRKKKCGYFRPNEGHEVQNLGIK